MGNTNVTFRDFLKEKIDKVKVLRQEKQQYITEVKKIQQNIDFLEDKRQTLRKGLHRDHQAPDRIQKALEDMQKRYETTSLK